MTPLAKFSYSRAWFCKSLQVSISKLCFYLSSMGLSYQLGYPLPMVLLEKCLQAEHWCFRPYPLFPFSGAQSEASCCPMSVCNRSKCFPSFPVVCGVRQGSCLIKERSRGISQNHENSTKDLVFPWIDQGSFCSFIKEYLGCRLYSQYNTNIHQLGAS